MTSLYSLKVAWKLSLRQIWQNPGRSALTLASITIGVAAVVAITISARATNQATDSMFQSLTGRASLEIASDSGGSMEADVIDRIRDIVGVKTIAPILQRQAILTFGEHRIKLITLGIDPASYPQVHPITITQGKSLSDAKGMLLEAKLAHSIGARPGDIAKILTRRGLLRVQIAGLFQSQETMITAGGAGLLMTLPASQYASKLPNKIHTAQLVLEPNANAESVRAEIANRLPPGTSVMVPGAKTSLADEASLSIRQGMITARAFLLLVATLIITNTYFINVTERRSQFGIMRAIGATKGQIAAILCCEASMLGTLGGVLGWLLGMAGASFVNDAMSRFYQTTLPSIDAGSNSLALAVLFGIGLSLVGVWLPASRAGRLSPAEAMRSTLTNETEGTSWRICLIGFACVVIGSLALAAGIAQWMPTDSRAWSGVLILLGMVLMVPMFVNPLSAWVAYLMKPFASVESRLARLQLLRHRTRTALTIGVLFISISTGIGLASSVIDNVNDVQNWYRRTMVADYFVRAMSPDMATGQAADMPDNVGEEISRIDHINSIETARFVSGRVNDRSVIVVAFDSTGSLSEFVSSMVEGDAAEGRTPQTGAFQEQDDVVIGSVLAKRAGLKAGDSVSLETDGGAVSLRIAAVMNDYLAGGQTVYMFREAAEKLLGVSGVDAYLIHAERMHLDQVRDDLQAVTSKHGLLLESFSDVRDEIDHRMAGVVAVLWAMVAIGFIVATLGVANTLTMNILEQTRELGLLRIVGATQRQIRQIIFSQAIMMGVLALVPGGVAGVVIAHLIGLTTYSFSGHVIAVQIHPALVLACVTSGFLVVIAAAWSPARRAAKLPLLKTISQR